MIKKIWKILLHHPQNQLLVLRKLQLQLASCVEVGPTKEFALIARCAHLHILPTNKQSIKIKREIRILVLKQVKITKIVKETGKDQTRGRESAQDQA